MEPINSLNFNIHIIFDFRIHNIKDNIWNIVRVLILSKLGIKGGFKLFFHKDFIYVWDRYVFKFINIWLIKIDINILGSKLYKHIFNVLLKLFIINLGLYKKNNSKNINIVTNNKFLYLFILYLMIDMRCIWKKLELFLEMKKSIR